MGQFLLVHSSFIVFSVIEAFKQTQTGLLTVLNFSLYLQLYNYIAPAFAILIFEQIAFLELEPGTILHRVVLLDSANPQFVVGTVSYVSKVPSSSRKESKTPNNKTEGRTEHEICVWRLQPTPKVRLSAADLDKMGKGEKRGSTHISKYKMELKLGKYELFF